MKISSNSFISKFFAVVCVLLFPVFCVGQEPDENGNWLKDIGIRDDFYSRYEFRLYTKNDVIKAKAKYEKVTESKQAGEWEGSYSRGQMLGSDHLVWNQRDGFVYYSLYHTLRALDYGIGNRSEYSVQFSTERLDSRRFVDRENLVFVRFGRRHLLVPEDQLGAFAVFVSGREIHSEDYQGPEEDIPFWEKDGEKDLPISEIPEFPAKYKHLILKPIESSITSVGKPKIKSEVSEDGTQTYETQTRIIKLANGSKNGIKVGMKFWIDDIDEWVRIISAKETSSMAIVENSIVEGKRYCSKYENREHIDFECRDPVVGMKLRTRQNYF